jgi:hypothetical protein
MKYETLLRGSFVASFLGLIILQFFYFGNVRKFDEYKITTIKQIDSLQILTDSLREENFMLNVEIGRHEVSREEVLGKYPKVNKEYQKFYEHETE